MSGIHTFHCVKIENHNFSFVLPSMEINVYNYKWRYENKGTVLLDMLETVIRSRRRMVLWFRDPFNSAMCAVAGIILILHFVALFAVDDRIYDEAATVAEANFMLYGEDMDAYYLAWAERNDYPIDEYLEVGLPHHMPLGKLIVAGSILTFGDNSFGWRIFPVLFGVASIIIVYLLCQKLTNNNRLSLIATIIYAFENMCFVMSGIAMLDIFGFTLMLASFLLYFNGKYWLAGIILALTVLAKVNYGLGAIVIVLHWLLTDRQSFSSVAKLFGISLAVFFVMLPILDFIAIREIIYPWERILNFIDIHHDPTLALSPQQYRDLYDAILPWDWIINPKTVRIWQEPSYQMNVNWTLWFLIIPLMSYMLFEALKQRKHKLPIFVIIWLVWGYFIWFIIYWAFDRVSYPFYFLSIVPAVCMAAAYSLDKITSLALIQERLVIRYGLLAIPVIWMGTHVVLFWLMAPIM